MRIEILSPPRLAGNTWSRRLVAAAAKGLGRDARVTPHPGDARAYVIWGTGHAALAPLFAAAQAGGPAVHAFDLGYWSRRTHVRVSVNAAHPQALVMLKDREPARFDTAGIALRHDFDPSGPVIVAGMGRKSAQGYGEREGEWDRKAVADCRAAFPGREVHYRPKPGGGIEIEGVAIRREPDVGDVLRGASLVVARHSNLAVDAIVAGVPAVCEDGAAAAVCPARIEQAGPPLPDVLRRRFLANLAWFQWSFEELATPAAWNAILALKETAT